MNNLIDTSYFIGDINIAQLGQRTVINRVEQYIAKYEPVYLLKLLGYAFSKLFNEGREEAEPAERWTNLIEGDEYTNEQGITSKWTGFTNDALISPIANYVYYWYTRDNASQTTASGEKSDNIKESVNVGPAMKQVHAWNEMVMLNRELYSFLINKKIDGNRVYPEFDPEKVGCEATDLLTKINAEPFLL